MVHEDSGRSEREGVGVRPSEPSIELTARGVERLDAALAWARRELRTMARERHLDRGRLQIALEKLAGSGRYTVRLRFIGPRTYASAHSAGRDLARAMKAAFETVRGRLPGGEQPPEPEA